MAWEGGGEYLCQNQGLRKIFWKKCTVLKDEKEAKKDGVEEMKNQAHIQRFSGHLRK